MGERLENVQLKSRSPINQCHFAMTRKKTIELCIAGERNLNVSFLFFNKLVFSLSFDLFSFLKTRNNSHEIANHKSSIVYVFLCRCHKLKCITGAIVAVSEFAQNGVEYMSFNKQVERRSTTFLSKVTTNV